MMKTCIVAYSGGLDSTVLLLYLIKNNFKIKTVSFDYGQKHKCELDSVKKITEYLKIENIRIDLTSLTSHLFSTLVSGNSEVPEGHYSGEEMKQTVVPNRNKIFNSIIQSLALSEYERNKEDVYIASGIHAGSGKIYPDTTKEFNDLDFKTFQIGNWNSEFIYRIFPFQEMQKHEIVKYGFDLCAELNLDIKETLGNTFTSYKPININGINYSDIKSSSSLKRIEAFKFNKLEDPIRYSDGIKELSWQEVINLTKDLI